MYLRQLNEVQKSLFLEIACSLASVDGDFSEDEELMLDMYCQEMEIPFVVPVMNAEQEELMDRIVEACDEQAARIFIYELVGLAISDLRFDVSEKRLIRELNLQFELPGDFVDDCEQLILEYLDVQDRTNQLILDMEQEEQDAFL